MSSVPTVVETIAKDVRYALRWFRRELSVTGAIVLTLAFGIGMNTAVFSILSGMVFRSRVEKDSASFFQVLSAPPAQADGTPRLFASSVADLAAFRSAKGLASMAAWTVSSGRIEEDPDPTLLMLVSCDFFPLYGLEHAKSGRLFESSECTAPSNSGAMLIGEHLWRERYHADPGILGRQTQIGAKPYTIVGVVPQDFAGRLRGPGIWIPLAAHPNFYAGRDLFQDDTHPWLTVEGRQMSGYSRTALAGELRTLAHRNIVLTNGSLFGDPCLRAATATMSVLLFGALGLILLLACTNVTMLLLSRAVARRYEMSVRLALGASHGRLLSMAATEGILLAMLSGGISATIATLLPHFFQSLVPQMPHYPVRTDWLVFGYLAGITLLAGSLAALVPAAEFLRSNISGSMKRQESSLALGGRRLRLREMLVAAQVAMSLVLVVGASLFARTQYRLFLSDPGFDSTRVIACILTGGGPAEKYENLEAALRVNPSVQEVARTTSLYWSRAEGTTIRLAAGRTEDAAVTAVSADFFATLGVPLIKGEPLRNDAGHSAVVSEAAAAQLWPNARAVGQTFAFDGATWEVAGVYRESELDRRSPVPRIYRLLDSRMAANTIIVRSTGNPDGVSRETAAAVSAAGLQLRELPRTVGASISEMGSRFRVMTSFATFFGISAFVLAVIGIYGVMAFSVSRRTREMGIRLALGATRGNIVREVLGSGLRPVAWGFGVGLPLACGFAWGLQYAFHATPTPFYARDPVAFGPVPLLLVVAAVLAMLKPALRACSANPAASLRQD